MRTGRIKKRSIALLFYFFLLAIAIYWMLNMSLRSNADILGSFALYPAQVTFANYLKVFTDASWYSGYINGIIYVSMNTVMSLAFALPAAYAFSRYKFLGDGQMFFWLLTNRMATCTPLRITDFKSVASTSSATGARSASVA